MVSNENFQGGPNECNSFRNPRWFYLKNSNIYGQYLGKMNNLTYKSGKLMYSLNMSIFGCFNYEYATLRLMKRGVPGWLSWLSIWLLISAQVMIPLLWVWAPHGVLHWQHCTCLRFCFPLSLCPSPAHALSLSKISKETLKIDEKGF